MILGLVSIITPSYNCEKFISGTIHSVLDQTYKNWELLIVDDQSTDNSVRIITQFLKEDNRIQLFRQKVNSGVAICRNLAIEKSKGEFIAFLDSDDLWLPKKLSIQISFMIKNHYNFTYTSYFFIDDLNNTSLKTYGVRKKVSYENMLYSNRIGCLSVVLNQLNIGKIYMPDLRKRQDYACWLKILKTEKFAYGIEKPLAKYRIRKDSMSSNKFEMLKWNFKLFHKTLQFSFLKSCYFVICNVFIKITE
jgi:glycosyltransferase involved in cell wall biosynthesis